MGKGSKRRPQRVDDKTMESNWDRIFGKKDSDQPREYKTGFQRALAAAEKEMTVVMNAGERWKERTSN